MPDVRMLFNPTCPLQVAALSPPTPCSPVLSSISKVNMSRLLPAFPIPNEKLGWLKIKTVSVSTYETGQCRGQIV